MKPVPPNLICEAFVDHRQIRKRVTSTQLLHPSLDNQWAREHTQQRVLHMLGIAAYPGTPGLEATYENLKHRVLQGARQHEINDVVTFIETARDWFIVVGGREAIKDTVPTIWRPATETDL